MTVDRKRKESDAVVAERMADAVAYLITVAREAGLGSISSDLLAIRRKLRARAKVDDASPPSPASNETDHIEARYSK
ncbi:hypothetical protein GA0061098_101658 [Bradyrhizobium shewense]|uniref:Uncharacterized protein n=1 Tax=Bradyrhizobium shewense TaxID=1761772 RepID=A0A1C3XHR4_9BRAD|nr:hypothetical protein GA0061098_101658 [Bradyrhizobium shewense]